MPSDNAQVGRTRITQIFRYLQALNQIRNPIRCDIREYPWTLYLRTLPVHPMVSVGRFDAENGDDSTPASDNDYVLKVARPIVQPAPTPPDEISAWLLRGWDDIHQDIRIQPKHETTGDEGEPIEIAFEDDPDRVAALQEWRLKRDRWVQEQTPAYETLEMFQHLYKLYGELQRESERLELVLGDGLLNWRHRDGTVNHPILLMRLHIEFRSDVPEFIVRQADYPVELYSALFQTINEVSGQSIARMRSELDEGQYHPLGDVDTAGYLRRFAATLAAAGEFVNFEPTGYESFPRIGRSPVLYLRNRAVGFATALENIVRDVPDRDDLPTSLLRVTGIEPPVTASPTSSVPASNYPPTTDILLSKPANPEQIQIAQRLEQHGCVLVQGPPGTGKTHTIANLIGHLLAQGKTILVTSHTAKALKVPRGHVVEALQPLCVSVLDSDGNSQEQLKSSVSTIVTRLAEDSAEGLEAEASKASQHRNSLMTRLAEVEAHILNVIGGEYRDIVVDGRPYAPSEAARLVAEGTDRHDWIPGPLRSTTLPLSLSEIAELYSSNTTITVDIEHELAEPLPHPDTILAPSLFERLMEERSKLEAMPTSGREDLWQRPTLEAELPVLERTIAHLSSALTVVEKAEPWELAIIAAGANETRRQLWKELIALVEVVAGEAVAAERDLLERGPAIGDALSSIDLMAVLEEIIGHLKQHRSLSALHLLMKPAWKRVQKECTVNGNPPKETGDFQALQTLLRLSMRRKELALRWERQVTSNGGPQIKPDVVATETFCARYKNRLEVCNDWYVDTWRPIEQALQEAGFLWQRFAQTFATDSPTADELATHYTSVVGSLAPLLTARVNRVRARVIEEAIVRLVAALETGGNSRIVKALRQAVAQSDVELYREGFESLVETAAMRGMGARRRELLTRLDAAAPNWAAAVRERCLPHGANLPPGDVGQAWLWSQLRSELDRRAGQSLDQLFKQRERLNREVQQATASLIENRAWACQLRRTSLSQRQSLMGWLNIVRRIGKGTGKRAAKLSTEARSKMQDSRTAVPVWIMPLSRVVENFDPASARFDVLIIDEASQADAMGLIPFYMANSVVVVGDNEQVSPDAVGEATESAQHLIDEYLQGIPNAVLYDGQRSVYDIAIESFGGHICLTEHFRCAPEIIQFSNMLSYDWKIKPLRDTSSLRRKPHVVAYRVTGATSTTKINLIEARTVVSLLMAASEQPEYEGATFGVISLVGEEQARQIDTLLQRYMPPEQYLQRKVMCGTAAQFQGDERDVMFLSVFDGPQSGPLTLRREGPRDMFKKRFNVAASRARDQMWVVHSLQPDVDLKPGDIRRDLILHAQNPSALLNRLEQAEQRVESEFERAVVRRLTSKGYRVKPQWKVGQYRIDLVVEDGGKRLAVECDGDRYHPLDKLPQDMARQALLERLGWTFVRIRGSLFFRDPDSAMAPVFAKLDDLDIRPSLNETETPSDLSGEEELRDRITRRAEVLRMEWDGILRPGGETTTQESTIETIPPLQIEQPVPFFDIAPPDIERHHAVVEMAEPTLTEQNGSVEGVLFQEADWHSVERGSPVDAEHRLRSALYLYLPDSGQKVERNVLLNLAAKELGYRRLDKELRSQLNKVINKEVNAKRLSVDAGWENVWKPAQNLSLFTLQSE